MRLLVPLTVVVCVCTGALAEPTNDPTAEQAEFFENKVRPLLVKRCHKCHGDKKQQGSLRLDSLASILNGGDTGPALVAGQPDQSELIRAVRYDPDGYQMPPNGKLPDDEVETLTRWVEMGAPWPNAAAEATHTGKEFNLQKRAQRWSFQPLTKPAIPSVKDSSWCRTPIDGFILSRLEAEGLTPAPPADRNTLLRRAALDVVGLPPTRAQVEQFVADDSPEAYETLVEKLLASPHFGERWGRHWLDLVRYAESRGHEFDHNVANAYQYRDYVIRALNDDVPYDQLVVEHVAGDLLESRPTELCDDASRPAELAAEYWLRQHPLSGANESILGTGFWFLGEWVHSPVDIRGDEAERFANMIDVYSKTFLGLTVACARCHDHKFDPITTADFYSLQGYLQSSHYRQVRFETMEQNRRTANLLQDLRQEAALAILPIYEKSIESPIDQLDDYLLAARDVIQRHPQLVTDSAADATAIGDFASNVAGERQLEADVITAWTLHLLDVARHDKEELFSPWARLCCHGDTELEQISEMMASARTRADDWEAKFGDQERDFAFDRRTRRVPLLSENDIGIREASSGPPLSDDPAAPYSRFGDDHATEVDSAFETLSVSAGTDMEPGATSVRTPGLLTTRTETFHIDQPFIILRVRGGCTTYLAVDSHILIRGPLHGTLFQKHDPPEEQPDGWRNIVLDVSRYLNPGAPHNAHLEITATPGTDFAVSSIQVAALRPPAPLSLPDWASLGPFGPRLTAETLAQAYQMRLASGLGSLVARQQPPNSVGPFSIGEADWIIRHPALFGLATTPTRQKLADVATPFIKRQRNLVAQIRPESYTAPAMLRGSEVAEPVFIRGNWKKPGEMTEREFLRVFDGAKIPRDPGQGDRLPLAKWMVDPAKTPILPRVIVNRIWQHYFGRGIVPTPDDFGYMGQEPSHPELLDWLATELVEHDWSLKHIHRLILSSAAYRMSSDAADPPASEVDPGNRLLHRMNVKRLEGEIIRDAVLTLSGRLDERLYGPSIPVHLTPFLEGRGRPTESGPVDGNGRRSLYIAVRRNFPEPFFQAFDMPNPHTTVGRRNVSNVPAQALAMMNNPFVIEQSARWSGNLLTPSVEADVRARVRDIYLSSLSREATEEDMAAALAFLGEDPPPSASTWVSFCHVLLNTKEFLFVR